MNQQSPKESQGGLGTWAREVRKRESYPIIYMFVVTAFFSAVLIGLARSTQERIEANRQIKIERAVLMAVIPDRVTSATASMEVHRLFVELIEPSPEREDVYHLVQDGQLEAYAVAFAGQGFWDSIRGVIGFETNKTTVRGIAFYEQNETPGLGAEITKPYFREQFENLEISEGPQPIDFVSPVSERQAGEVHAITGATQTSNRVERIVNERLREWLDRENQAKEGQGST